MPTTGGTEVLVRTPGPDAAEDLEPPARELTPDEEDVEEVVAQIPQEARVQVWRYENDDWSYLTTVIPHGFTLDALGKRWGGGKYRLVCRGPKPQDDGTVKIVQLFKRIVSVGSAAVPGTPGAPMIEQGLSNLLTLQSTMLGTLMQQINGQRDSTATMIQAIGALVKPAPSLSDDLMKLLLTKLMAEPKGGSTSLDEMLAVLDKGMELGAAAEGGDGMAGFARVFSDLLKDVRERRAAGGAAPEPKALPNPEATVAGHIEPKPDDPRVVAARKFFTTATAMLEGPSQQDGDLDLWADAVVELIPRELDDELEQWINDPTYPDPVMPFFPGVATVWLRALLLKVRDLLTGEDDGGDGQAPPVDGGSVPARTGGPGNDHDAAAHAPVRERKPDRAKRSSMRPNRHGGV